MLGPLHCFLVLTPAPPFLRHWAWPCYHLYVSFTACILILPSANEHNRQPLDPQEPPLLRCFWIWSTFIFQFLFKSSQQNMHPSLFEILRWWRSSPWSWLARLHQQLSLTKTGTTSRLSTRKSHPIWAELLQRNTLNKLDFIIWFFSSI